MFIHIFQLFWHQRICDTTLGSRDIAMRRFFWRTCWRAGIWYSSSWIDIWVQWMFWETLLESKRRMLVQLASFNANSLGRDILRDVMQYICIELTFWKRQQHIPEREILERAEDEWICFYCLYVGAVVFQFLLLTPTHPERSNEREMDAWTIIYNWIFNRNSLLNHSLQLKINCF